MDIEFSCNGHRFAALEEGSVAFVIHESGNPSEGRPKSVTAGGEAVVVLSLDGNKSPGREELLSQLQEMLQDDDVTQDGFLKKVLVCGSDVNFDVSPDDQTYYTELGHEVVPIHIQSHIPNGPYYALASRLRHVFRLYADPLQAFMFGMAPKEGSDQSGKRIAVKDVYHIRGVPTSASSRDFRSFFGDAKVTAPMIQRLIDAGAVIVGKTKTAQFASGEYAPDWVDYSCPFNPRGDGYMDPGGSSTGSAVAIAGYHWLDFAIGTDTLGSVVGPAASEGIFGLRPTHGISDLKDVIPVSSGIADMLEFGKFWYGSSTSLDYIPPNPSRMLYAAEEFAKFPGAMRAIMEDFINDLERYSGRARIPFDITQAWQANAPSESTRPIQEYLENSLAHIQLYGSYQNNLPFRQQFKEKSRREPYANPMVRFKWALGEELTTDDFNRAVEQQQTYRQFLIEHVFTDNTILILPGGSESTRYRDVYDNPDVSGRVLQGFGFRRELYAFLGGLPEIVIPVGQVPARSPVTGASVMEPVSVSIIGGPKMDCAIMDLALQVMRSSKRPLTLNTGSCAFDEPTA
ncbi:amidase signature domain-containing protein [Aspergillus californicus]